MRRRKSYDEKGTSSEAIHGRTLCLCVSKCHSTKGNQEATKQGRGPFRMTEINQQGRFIA